MFQRSSSTHFLQLRELLGTFCVYEHCGGDETCLFTAGLSISHRSSGCKERYSSRRLQHRTHFLAPDFTALLMLCNPCYGWGNAKSELYSKRVGGCVGL